MAIKHLALLLFSGLLFGIPGEGIAGQIIGTVVDSGEGEKGTAGDPIVGIQVHFFDALNAELLGTSDTGSTGVYDSGIIPDGDYRVRFTDPFGHNSGVFVTKFSGTEFGGFCDAVVIPVLLGSTETVDEMLVWRGPQLEISNDFNFRGIVLDAASLAPLQGIQVNFLIGEIGDPITTATTDVDGLFDPELFTLQPSGIVKIRYVDPSGIYFPEYQGADSTDDFCAGTSFLMAPKVVEGFMDRIPPDENPQVLIDAVEDLNLPNNVSTMLGTPLSRAVDLLTDDNPNNDTAVCNQLASFISRVDIQERHGRLTASDAADLILAAEALRAELGC